MHRKYIPSFNRFGGVNRVKKIAKKALGKTNKNGKTEKVNFAQNQLFVTFTIFVSENLKNTNVN